MTTVEIFRLHARESREEAIYLGGQAHMLAALMTPASYPGDGWADYFAWLVVFACQAGERALRWERDADELEAKLAATVEAA